MNEYQRLVEKAYRDMPDWRSASYTCGLEHTNTPFGKRREWVWEYAWAIPNDGALAAIAACGPIVEIGAGAGYWAYLLQERGVDVVAYDREPQEKTWTKVHRGSVRVAQRYANRALFLCWPPYNTPMGARCLKQYRGRTVIYVGEGMYGCTGDREFHDILEQEYEDAWDTSIEIPQYDGIHDRLYIHRRKGLYAV
jgi:hypothetical protein